MSVDMGLATNMLYASGLRWGFHTSMPQAHSLRRSRPTFSHRKSVLENLVAQNKQPTIPQHSPELI